ncbi:TraB/GumN family protein [Parasphingopyxis sp.]|uniref:TraB/GumN family protein n=1 Tax=Parasphingopyxis sp. TaxID=1920299 RepID=UPI00260EC9F0|nr:TraB/GumN family protein [Parasphingopyxis sp.]
MPLRSVLKFAIRAAALPLFAVAAPAAPPPEPSVEPDRTLEAGAPQPAIWLLSDADTRIWLFGTNHVLPHSFAWRSPELDAIIAEADELILESSEEEAAELYADTERFAAMMMLDEPVPILNRVSREYRMPLWEVIKYSSIELDELDQMQTWMVILYLIAASFENAYGEGEDYAATGVEYQLIDIFDAQDKPIGAVERPMEQIDFFRLQTEERQRELLESLVGSGPPDSESAAEDTLLQGWVTGNMGTMAEQCDDADNFPPVLRELLLVQRNANWIEWLVDRLDRPGDVLFAVGACHLAGTASVQTMLEARGYAIERVQ